MIEFDVVWNGSVRAVEPFQRTPPAPTLASIIASTPGAGRPYRIARLAKICRGGGETFLVRVSEAARRHCCSVACLSRPLPKVCPVCQGPFSVKFRSRDQVYCSHACAGRDTASQRGASHMAVIGRLGGLRSVAERRRRKAVAA